MNGSGKSESADFFSKKKLPVISFGDILNEKVEEMNLPQTEEIHRKMRNDIRKEHGFEGFAVLNIDKIKKELDKKQKTTISKAEISLKKISEDFKKQEKQIGRELNEANQALYSQEQENLTEENTGRR